MMYQEEKVEKTLFEKASLFFAALGSFIFSSIEAIVVALAMSVVLYLFLMTPHEVVGTSMVPNFQNGEHLIANKVIYNFTEPKRGDVVIFRHSETRDLIKRVIGIPGDKIALRDGKFYLNNRVLNEAEYLDPTVYTSGGEFLHEGESVELSEGQYFVAGDNRPHSSDSRFFGTIEGSAIKGKAWLVYFPFENLRTVKKVQF